MANGSPSSMRSTTGRGTSDGLNTQASRIAKASAASHRRSLLAKGERSARFSSATDRAPHASGISRNVATGGRTPSDTRPLKVREATKAARTQDPAGAARATVQTTPTATSSEICGAKTTPTPSKSAAIGAAAASVKERVVLTGAAPRCPQRYRHRLMSFLQSTLCACHCCWPGSQPSERDVQSARGSQAETAPRRGRVPQS